MAKNADKITYIFLASRKYPIPSGDFDYTYFEDATSEITKKAGQEIVALDVTTKFSNTWEGNVSSYPISSGADITDHISIRNNKYVLEGVVSDTPIEIHKNEYYGDGGTGADRIFAAIEMLEYMFKNRVLFTLFSEYQQIDNAVITGVSFEQTAQYAVNITIQMEQVRFAYAKTVNLNVKPATKKKVASNQNGGGSTKVEADRTAYKDNINAEIKKNNSVNNGR